MTAMNEAARAAATECTRASDAEAITFPHVIALLMEAGVERYHADLVRAEKIYFTPDDASLRTPCAALEIAPAQHFDAAGVQVAVRAIQAGRIAYHGFCAQIAAAGCVGYFVSLVGHCAVYYGRNSESHIEQFPTTN
jgi:uncharacterized protein YbcV (DUF1398 family)